MLTFTDEQRVFRCDAPHADIRNKIIKVVKRKAAGQSELLQ